MWFHLLPLATTEPFWLAVDVASRGGAGEVGPLVRGLSDGLEEPPVEDAATAELVTGMTPDCFAL